MHQLNDKCPWHAEAIHAAWKIEMSRRLEKKHPDKFPTLPEIPAARYVCQDFFALEKTFLWTRTWLLVAHLGELPQPGSYKAFDVIGKPVLAVRDQNGDVGVFFNSCKHRGARLVQDDKGITSRLNCPYHAWSYDLGGTLKYCPDDYDFPALSKCQKNLTKIRSATLGNLLFICFDNNAKSLDCHLGAMKDMISDVPWSETRLYQTRHFDVDCNWKFIHDAFSETYHVSYVHPKSVNAAINRTYTARLMLRNGHNAMYVKNRADEKEMASHNVFDQGGIDQSVKLQPITKEGQRSYNIFPNITVPVAENLSVIMVLWPLASNKTKIALYYIKVDPDSPIDTDVDRATVNAFNQITQEDINALRGIHEATAGSGIISFVVGYGEQFIYNYHREIDNIIGADNIPQALRVAQVELPLI